MVEIKWKNFSHTYRPIINIPRAVSPRKAKISHTLHFPIINISQERLSMIKKEEEKLVAKIPYSTIKRKKERKKKSSSTWKLNEKISRTHFLPQLFNISRALSLEEKLVTERNVSQKRN